LKITEEKLTKLLPVFESILSKYAIKPVKIDEKTNDDWICQSCKHEWKADNSFISYGDCPKCGSD
jgi:uncharacterized CHY-type Zn-finger protein